MMLKLVVTGGLVAALAAVDAIADRVNPFVQPAREAQVTPDRGAPVAGRLELRGLIVAGDQSIANLNGTLLAIGESQDGYELTSVGETSATFRHEDRLVTLELAEEDGGTDD